MPCCMVKSVELGDDFLGMKDGKFGAVIVLLIVAFLYVGFEGLSKGVK